MDPAPHSLLRLGGVLHQLLVVLGLAPADPGQGDSPTPFDPAALQQQLDSLQEQLRALQQGPGGGDGDGVTLLDPGNLGGLLNGDGGNGPTPFDLGGLGGIGTPPPPGSAAS